MYPYWTKQEEQIPAKLVRSHETLSQTGDYTFSIGKVLTTDEEVDSLLPYYE